MSRETSIQTLRQRQRLSEWSQRVADCRQSGMSAKRWCDENGVSAKTCCTWQKKVFKEQQKLRLEAKGEDGCFVEFPAPRQIRWTPGELAASIQVGQASVNIYSGADPELAQVPRKKR